MFRVMTFGRARLSFLLAVILIFATLVIPATGVMADTTVTVHGTVRDNLANPFPNAEVQVIDPATGNTLVSAITDIGGNYTLSVATGTYTIQVTPPPTSGFGTAISPNRTINNDTLLDFVLVPPGDGSLERQGTGS